MSQLSEFLTSMVQRGGSDLILKEGRPPLLRLAGQLVPSEFPEQTSQSIWENLHPILSDTWRQRLEAEREVDLSFEVGGIARFRVNVFYQRARLGAVIRAVPLQTPTIDDLGLPPVLKDIAQRPHGIVLVTGPTGSGKSTTLAAIVEQINLTRRAHIITIEDPIEFVYEDKLATVTQRGIGDDTLDAGRALRAALRQDPDVILAGEMRDRETMDLALHAAQTGHLVLSTLHTNDAKQSILRIVDAYPPEAQTGLLRMLSQTLEAVVSQRLIPKADGAGRIAAHEVLIASPAIRGMIEQGKVEDIAKAIASSSSYYRMQSFNQALAELVNKRLITSEVAMESSSTPGDLQLLLRGMGRGGQVDMRGGPGTEEPEPVGEEAPAAEDTKTSGGHQAATRASGGHQAATRASGGHQAATRASGEHQAAQRPAGWGPSGGRPPRRRGPLRPSTRLARPAPDGSAPSRPKINRGFDFG